ncbi:hypothetical protein AKO1_015572, partial [Acrasis kona]
MLRSRSTSTSRDRKRQKCEEVFDDQLSDSEEESDHLLKELIREARTTRDEEIRVVNSIKNYESKVLIRDFITKERPFEQIDPDFRVRNIIINNNLELPEKDLFILEQLYVKVAREVLSQGGPYYRIKGHPDDKYFIEKELLGALKQNSRSINNNLFEGLNIWDFREHLEFVPKSKQDAEERYNKSIDLVKSIDSSCITSCRAQMLGAVEKYRTAIEQLCFLPTLDNKLVDDFD